MSLVFGPDCRVDPVATAATWASEEDARRDLERCIELMVLRLRSERPELFDPPS